MIRAMRRWASNALILSLLPFILLGLLFMLVLKQLGELVLLRKLSKGLAVLLTAGSLLGCTSFLADAEQAERFVSAAAASHVVGEVKQHLVAACRKSGREAVHRAKDAQRALGSPQERRAAAASSQAQTEMKAICRLAGVQPGVTAPVPDAGGLAPSPGLQDGGPAPVDAAGGQDLVRQPLDPRAPPVDAGAAERG